MSYINNREKMDKNSKTEVEIKESIQVYPTIKPIIEEAESKKYLYFFCKKTETKNKQEKLDNKKISKEKEQNHLDKEEEYYLINKVEKQKVAVEKAESKQQQNINSLPIRAYLDQTVVPLVLQGMAEVAKERPENPIKYLADFLMKHANDK